MELSELIMTYGLEIAILSILAIMCVGLLKLLFKAQLEKLGKSNSKPIYETASIVFAFLLTAVWMLIKGVKDIAEISKKAVLVYAAVKVMYPLYENYKLRDLLKLLVGLVASKAKEKIPVDQEKKK